MTAVGRQVAVGRAQQVLHERIQRAPAPLDHGQPLGARPLAQREPGRARQPGHVVVVLAVARDHAGEQLARRPRRQARQGGGEPFTVVLSLTPLRRVMKDYFMVCESYYQAIRTAPPSRIQSIDMGRRALHNEGSRVLSERLQGKIAVDDDTARRLFTLICALHWKG